MRSINELGNIEDLILEDLEDPNKQKLLQQEHSETNVSTDSKSVLTKKDSAKFVPIERKANCCIRFLTAIFCCCRRTIDTVNLVFKSLISEENRFN